MSNRWERPYPMVSETLALRWYLDSDHTHLVVMGARILDWLAWTSHQISEEEYTRRSLLHADEVRRERDGHQVEEQQRRVEHGWAEIRRLYQELGGGK